jgi:hypothetical protein
MGDGHSEFWGDPASGAVVTRSEPGVWSHMDVPDARHERGARVEGGAELAGQPVGARVRARAAVASLRGQPARLHLGHPVADATLDLEWSAAVDHRWPPLALRVLLRSAPGVREIVRPPGAAVVARI